MIDKEQAIKVLGAWHRVEFFQTYSLPDKKDEELIPIDISFNEIKRCGDTLLPWLNVYTQRQLGLDPSKETTYTLYLGLFDKAVLSRVAEKCYSLSHYNHNIMDEEIEQRLDSEGDSCFAKLRLNEFGKPDWHSFSISTLPWALGHLLNNSIDKVTLSNFDGHSVMLMEAFDRISIGNQENNILNSEIIAALVKQIYSWAGLKFNDLSLSTEEDIFCFRLAYYQRERKQLGSIIKDLHDENEDETAKLDETKLPILNSFYIRDLENAINSVKAGTASKGLLQYLSSPGKRHTDLYSDKAISLIAKNLHPINTPQGRWPSDPQYNMSLMQQFAVNTAYKELSAGGIISVNGPPGTGKTTLLRDVIAQNIVERAKVLACLNKASEGIDKDGFLIELLSGYEMVVASSNNAAVENISKELPQKDSLWDGYTDCEYLKSVANQLNAKKYKEKLLPIKEEKKQCWGTISAVMGAKKKRDDFSNRFFFHKHFGNDVPKDRAEEINFLPIWQQFSNVKSISFYEAKKDFLSSIQDFDNINSIYIQFDNLRTNFCAEKYEQKILILKKNIISDDQKIDLANLDLKDTCTSINVFNKKEKISELALDKLKLYPPGFLSKLFNTKKNKLYTSNLHQKISSLELIKKELLIADSHSEELNHYLLRLKKKRQVSLSKIVEITAEKASKEQELSLLAEAMGECILPDATAMISDAKLQQNAYWQDKNINDLRSKVFISALKLHQAWLYEVRTIASFKSKMFQLVDCLKATKDGLNDEKLWQIIFMFVPVISTTFASLGRMFSKLNDNSIGWLMIDEAGQAVPQAAIGGLLRAKRTIVVGDPLQIEPVFTSSPALVDFVMESVLGSDKDKWSPASWSVQELADRVNPYGCMLKVQDEEKWIGIPLWVHRRCINPMFDIANKIAYEERMIHGNYKSNKDVPVVQHPQLKHNRWVEVTGNCTYKQYSKQLGEKVLELLIDIVDNGGVLKNVYIISPFKAVKSELKNFIRQNGKELEKDKNLNSFLKNNVGTVHTFQGKESDTVILALGCDRNNQGGAIWASSKPNLLNVALTRAKKNVFVVGDSFIWADKQFFSDCFSSLSIKEDIKEN